MSLQISDIPCTVWETDKIIIVKETFHIANPELLLACSLAHMSYSSAQAAEGNEQKEKSNFPTVN